MSGEGKEEESIPPGAEEKAVAAQSADNHARFDDPVEPPARNARKNKSGQAGISNGQSDEVTLPVLPTDSKSILSRLFDPDRKQKPQLWTHIKLVAPGPVDQPPPGHIKWRSRHAIAAYCLKCKKQFTYTRGTSKTVSRHMEAYHGLLLNENDTPQSKGSSKRSGEKNISSPPLKKRSISQSSQAPELQLLKWIASSFQPWSIVESDGLHAFCSSLSDSFSVPTTKAILLLAMDNVEKIKLEMRRQLKDCDNFSLTCQEFANKGVDYTSVGITFCTDSFQRRHVSLGTIQGKCSGPTIQSLLDEYELQPSSTTNVTLVNVQGLVNLNFGREESCVLGKLSSIVQGAISAVGEIEELIVKVRVADDGTTGWVRSGSLTAYMPSNPTEETVESIYSSLQRFSTIDKSENEAEASLTVTKDQAMIIRVVTAALKPFFDAHNTLVQDAYPTIGLAIPVVRRVQDVLGKIDINNMVAASKEKKAIELAKEFHKTLLSMLSSAFSYILDENPTGMWTMPLDPRLIHGGALSEQEKESMNKMLFEKVKEKKLSSLEAGDKEKASLLEEDGGKTNKNDEKTTMGGIFWGDDTGESESSRNYVEAAELYARSSVDRYFTTVKSQRRIEDPLVWWQANRKKFPELANLARVWLAAPVIGPTKDSRADYQEGNLELIVFLHDNAHLIAS